MGDVLILGTQILAMKIPEISSMERFLLFNELKHDSTWDLEPCDAMQLVESAEPSQVASALCPRRVYSLE